MRTMRVFEALAEVSMQAPVNVANVIDTINEILARDEYKITNIWTQTLVGTPRFAPRSLDSARFSSGIDQTHLLEVALSRPRFALLDKARAVFRFDRPIEDGHREKLTRFLSFAYTEALFADRTTIARHITESLLKDQLNNLWRKVLDLQVVNIGQLYDLEVIIFDSESEHFHSLLPNRAIEPSSMVAQGIRTSISNGRTPTYLLSELYCLKNGQWLQQGRPTSSGARPFLILPLLHPKMGHQSDRDDDSAFLVVRPSRKFRSFAGFAWEEFALLDYVSKEISVVYNFIRTQQAQENDFEAITHGLVSNANKLIAISKDLDESLDDLWHFSVQQTARFVTDASQLLSLQSELSEAARPISLQSKDLYLYASDIKNQMLIAENIESSLSLADLGKRETRYFLADVLQVLLNLREVICRRYSRCPVHFNNFKEAGFDKFPAVKGDKSLILLVFRNLLDNSVKYNDSNSDRISITVKWHDRGDRVEIEYRDNGMGIEQHEMARLFKARYRSRRAIRKTGMAGRGLGLYHCATVLEAIGGGIIAVPQKRGSCFVVTLRKAHRG